MKFSKAIIFSVLTLLLFSCNEVNVEAQTLKDDGKSVQTVFFGNYPQKTKQAEPIKWNVIDSDADKVLLLSNNCIESLPWHKKHESITWDKSDIRVWLNGDFLKSAFTREEQNAILVTDLDNGDDLKYGTPVGKNTQDKIFLLSGTEINKYFSSDEKRTVKPTNYAISHGAYTNAKGNCAWWLRSPGMTRTSPAYIASAGSVGNRAHEVDEKIIGVRPAVWVKRDILKTANANPNASEKLVNTLDIWNKYDKNPEKNKPVYYGETETATGVITYIGRDSHGTPSMELSDTAGGKSYVLGVFGSYEEMSPVSVGDTVTISGLFHIVAEDKVVLKQCKILAIL